MGQGWHLWADGLRVFYLGKLGEGLFDGSITDLHKYLRRPTFPAPFPVPPYTEMEDKSDFARFPNEIVGKIFHALGQTVYEPVKDESSDAYGSMVSLCLTCSRMWEIGELECRKYLFKWGQETLTQRRLIILGDSFADSAEEIPEDWFNETDKQRFINFHFESGESEQLHLDLKPKVWRDNIFWTLMQNHVNGLGIWRLRKEKQKVVGLMDPDLLYKFQKAMNPEGWTPKIENILFPKFEGQEWVLRNLTTKEYVRDSIVAVPSTSNIVGITLGTALAIRICFSNPERRTNISRIYETKFPGPGTFDITQGAWKCCTFDVVDRAEVGGEGGDSEWKDVSEEVAREIDFVWGCEYGDEWEEMKEGNKNYEGFEPIVFT